NFGPWPADRPPYLRFALYKENVDTFTALRRLAAAVDTRPNMISCAGVKDKRGVTTQWCTVRMRGAEELAAACNAPRVPFAGGPPRVPRNQLVGNMSYVEAPLALGDLRGNRFRIALRNVSV
ncbi:unnamed protein product, partial [Phaeothamnion confervicola]